MSITGLTALVVACCASQLACSRSSLWTGSSSAQGAAGTTSSSTSPGGAGGGGTGGQGGYEPPERPCETAAWARSLGSDAAERALDLDIDQDCSPLVLGLFADTVDLGGGPMTALGGRDLFVAKLDGAGHHVWSRRIGTSGDSEQFGGGVAYDADGNVVVFGCAEGPLLDLSGLGGPTLAAGQGSNVLVVKLSPEGGYLWGHFWGDDDEQYASAVDLAPDGSIIVAGRFRGTLEPASSSLYSSTQYNSFGIALEPDGALRWAMQLPDPSTAAVHDIAVDPDSGDVLVVGAWSGQANFGFGWEQADGIDPFVLRLGADGQPLAARPYSAPEPQYALAVEAGDGVVWVGGQFRGQLDLDGAVFVSAGDYDGFVATLDAGLDFEQGLSFGGLGPERIDHLALSSDGHGRVAGSFEGSFSFGAEMLSSVDQEDGFLLFLAPSLDPLGALRFGGDGHDEAKAIVLDRLDQPHLVGSFMGTISLEGTVGTALGPVDIAAGTATSQGQDVLAAKLWQAPLR